MKNIFTVKKSLWLMAFVALLITSCFKLTSVVLSTNQIEQFETMTVTSTVVNAHFGAIDNDAFGLYGIRIPADWKVENVTAVNKYGNETVEFTGTPCDFYAALLQHCYPRDGYKWVAYQTEYVKYKLAQFEDGTESTADNVVVTATLKAGETLGDYSFDVVMGSSTKSQLEDNYSVNEDGSYDFSRTLNDFEEKEGGVIEYKKKPIDNLLETGTISDLERFVQNQELAKNDEYPGIANPITDQQLNVSVIRNTTSLEEAAAGDLHIIGDRGGIRVILQDAADNAEVAIYNVEGKMVDSKVVAGSEALLKAAKGTCIVKVVKGDKKIVKKIFVK